MEISPNKTLRQIAELLDVSFVGDADMMVTGLNEIHVVNPGDIVFVDHPKYYDKALNSAATVVLINQEVACPEGKGLLISKDPFRDFNFLINFFSPFELSEAQVSDRAQIGSNNRIHPSVFIGSNVKIGNNCIIHPNVVIYDNCEIGNNCIIHAGVVLGAHGFYYKNRPAIDGNPSYYDRLNSAGSVIIENNVELGALCTVDKGVTSPTIVGEGSKLDNQVHVGHDTVIGRKCLIAAQVGLAGCIVVEDEVTIWGQSGVQSGVTIGKGSVLLGQTGLRKDIEPNSTYFGSPAIDARDRMKELVLLKKLPKLIEELENIKKD